MTSTSTSRVHDWRCIASLVTLLSLGGLFSAQAQTLPPRQSAGDIKPAAAPRWGSSDTPFASTSPWNSRPIAPRLGSTPIRTAHFKPTIEAHAWSTGVFVSSESDRPATVHGATGTNGVWNADSLTFSDVTFAHWPSRLAPATGSDGHAEIIAPAEDIVHSFWRLRREGSRWVAAQYAWSRLSGRGWGDPAHALQGARAAGVPSLGGLIRKHEVTDGTAHYRHALAVSLDREMLSPSPGYVFPATSADTDAPLVNTGAIPLGALMMLPPSFDIGQLQDARLRKVALTLRLYGAYVVDRNEGTPFVLYAEIGAPLNLHESRWNQTAVEDLERMRAALRQVVGADGWLDGDNRRITPQSNLNLLSMRGPWHHDQGAALGEFDSPSQSLVFPAQPIRVKQIKTLPRMLTPVNWARPMAGEQLQLTCIASGGARLRLRLSELGSGRVLADSGDLENGESYSFSWPKQPIGVAIRAISGIGQPSRVGGELLRRAPRQPKWPSAKAP
ncbi:hypothetical protein [Pseudoduganella namucuonensis]|uniref:Atrophin-1 multi-domain protein n=1 Tax=Pseudoduganella namucuonensis TaxID=1035707 RepID=A0A1I7M4Z0_9BURK|nr:hypothetical protein [Pseudoduganella namucuonensis]SFV17014.1 hypothetical protein SAMN05216552_10589 [Pseudoduganella namucuonensis]